MRNATGRVWGMSQGHVGALTVYGCRSLSVYRSSGGADVRMHLEVVRYAA
jgi:hypothetical protein